MAGENSENPALVNAARLAIVDASRIQTERVRHQAHERNHLDWVFNDLAAQGVADAAPERAAERPADSRGGLKPARPAARG